MNGHLQFQCGRISFSMKGRHPFPIYRWEISTQKCVKVLLNDDVKASHLNPTWFLLMRRSSSSACGVCRGKALTKPHSPVCLGKPYKYVPGNRNKQSNNTELAVDPSEKKDQGPCVPSLKGYLDPTLETGEEDVQESSTCRRALRPLRLYGILSL